MGFDLFGPQDDRKSSPEKNDRAKSLENTLDGSFKTFELSKVCLPEGYELLNVMGKTFRQYKEGFGYHVLKYEKEILNKYGKFINAGRQNSDSKDIRPIDRVGFYSDGWYRDKPSVTYKFNQDEKAIYLDTEFPYKGESFVRGVLERCAFNGYAPTPGDGHIISKNGFSTTELDSQDKVVKTAHKGLHDGLMLALSEDVVTSVTGNGPIIITRPNYNNCKHPQELMKIARFVRDFVNTNSASKEDYSIQKDSLLHDCFVNGEISDTRKVMDSKCVPGTFDLLSDQVDKLINLEKGIEFAKIYGEIQSMFVWMKNFKNKAN